MFMPRPPAITDWPLLAESSDPYIRTDDQQRHPVFVHIDQGKICEILSEQEFEKTGVADFVHYW